MNLLFRKEARLLMPAWIGALVVATTPLWLLKEFESILPAIFCAGLLAVALSPFGQETSCGTFGLLLAQPTERLRFWRMKTGLLTAALVSVWALFALSAVAAGVHDPASWLKASALMTALAFSGGLWSTLLLRDTIPAFFCACLAPLTIYCATLVSMGHWIKPGSDEFTYFIVSMLALYAAAGFFWARRLFLNAQDLAWTGGQISLRPSSLFSLKRRANRWTVLVKKELQLQEVIVVVVPILVLLHLLVLATLHFVSEQFPREIVAEAIPRLWSAVVPLLIGCVAVAEERRLNTLEGQLCLPMSKRAQFAVKLAIVAFLGIVVGGMIPWLLVHAINPFLTVEVKIPTNNSPSYIATAALFAGIAFYASTMTRGMLQAIPTAVCIPLIALMALGLCGRLIQDEIQYWQYWNGWPFFGLGWKASVIFFAWLGFRNYISLQIGWRLWMENLTLSAVAYAIVMLTAAFLYERPWELFVSLEPPHGPARITQPGLTRLGASGSNLSALLPDGRIWIGKLDSSWKNISGEFVDGSNWAQMVPYRESVVAIRVDGTLWRIINRTDLRQIGSDSDWKKIVSGGDLFLAIKQDGTLWGWGLKRYGIPKKTPRTDLFIPARLGTDSNWIDVFADNDGEATGVKSDGTTWELGNVQYIHGTARYKRPTAEQPSRRGPLEGTNWISIAHLGVSIVAIRSDGSLWASGYFPDNMFHRTYHAKPAKVAEKSDWVSLSSYQGPCNALEANGALWTIRYGHCEHPSKYSDWIATTQDDWYTWALARDGTITCWAQRGIYTEHSQPSRISMALSLGPSRAPVVSGNIFGDLH